MGDLMDMYWRMPPVARTLATASFAASIAAYTGFLPFRWLYFHQALIFKLPPEIWRFFSSFLLTLPKMSIILDPYFLYSYTSQLEVGNPRFQRREDLVWYLSFVSLSIIVIDHLLGFRNGSYLQGLILALAYTCTQDQRGIKANFFFLTIPAQLVPYSMMLVTLLMVGPQITLVQLCGLLAAHLYDFLSRLWPEFGGGSNLIPTPAFMSRLVPTPFVRVEDRGFGAVFRGTGRSAGSGGGGGGGSSASASGSSTGATAGPLPDAWKTRGKGQRLGGD